MNRSGPVSAAAARLGRVAPWRAASPRGVVVLGMHRSGTSAATRLVNVLGPATCPPDAMVRGPWNPNGHFESRALMHLNNALLAQMGRTWWYPPPAGPDYDAVAARITTTTAQARRVFRRVHRVTPWVWKDPRTSVLVPFWRDALGPHLAAVVVVRNPLEVAHSLRRRHGVPLSFGVALWERYNRLIVGHSAGMAVHVTRFDDLVTDPRSWSEEARAFLAGLGMALAPMPPGPGPGEDVVDAGLRHAEHSRDDLVAAGAAGATALALYDALESVVGPSRSFVPPRSAPSRPRWRPSSTRWARAPSSRGTRLPGPRGAPAGPVPGRSRDMTGRIDVPSGTSPRQGRRRRWT